MKNLNYHKKLNTISIYRLNQIKESISEGVPEYRHMLVLDKYEQLPEIKPTSLKLLEIAYLGLIEQMPEVSTDLISSYRVYLESFLEAKIAMNRAKIEELKGEAKENTKYAQNSRDFSEYINVLNNDYTNFKIVEYFIKDDFKEIFELHFPTLEYVKEFDTLREKVVAFYVIDRYIYEVNNLKINDSFKEVFLSPNFISLFIDSREIVINELMPYVDRLRKEFMLNDNYIGYVNFRHKVFGLNNFSFEPGHTYDFLQEVVNVKRILGLNFDIHEISALEYHACLSACRAKVQKESKPDKAV